MAADPLDQVLRLVAEGRLTAEEAAPILAALDAGASADVPPGPGSGPAAEPASPSGSATGPGSGSGSLRIEVIEGGRQVVNLRLPIAVGRLALDRVPGLSGQQVDRVRDALRTGMRGPVLEVNDGDSAVRIVLE